MRKAQLPGEAGYKILEFLMWAKRNKLSTIKLILLCRNPAAAIGSKQARGNGLV
jgi:hypothetical protein